MQSIIESLKLVLSRQFGIEADKINNETHLVDDLGADSLDLMEIVMIIESKFKVRIEEAEYNNALIVGEIINLISQKLKDVQ
jgi:acyl carrier protein